MKFIIVLWSLLVTGITSDKIGQFEVVEYSNLLRMNEFKHGRVILVAYDHENNVQNTVQDELEQFKKHVGDYDENHQTSHSMFAIKDYQFPINFVVIKFPQVVFYRHGRFIHYNGEIKAQKLNAWFENSMERLSRDLGDGNFEHDTQASTGSTTGDWFVMFHKTNCRTQHFVESAWELASLRLENRVLFAYVDFDKNPKLKDRFNLHNDIPTLIFFKNGIMYRYELSDFSADAFVSFVTGSYKNFRGEPVPKELTAFDNLVDSIVRYLKKQKLEKHINTGVLAMGSIVIIIIVLFVYYKCIRKQSKSSKRDREYHKLE